MKKMFKMATLAVAATMFFCACNNGNMQGYSKTEKGLYYRFDKTNEGAEMVKNGDVLVGEMVVSYENDTVFNNVGRPSRILQAMPTFDGDIYEGLLMMHIGDKASFAVDMDTVAKYYEVGQMPPSYQPNKGMKIYYTIKLIDIVSRDILEQEQQNLIAQIEARRNAEPDEIAQYIRSNNIKTKPTNDGLYVIVKKMGKGKKVGTGANVAINYTGCLLDGTMFDSSVESDARQGGIYDARRKYEPITYTVGRNGMIKGWEEGIDGMPAGSVLTLIIPSKLAYGEMGVPNRIPPYSSLVFDMEIISVE